MKHWTQKEIYYLKENYPKKLNKELSVNLKRKAGGINYMAYKLGLKKDYNFYCKSRKKYKKEFTKKLFKNLYINKKKSIREIAKELNLGKNTVDHYLKKYKISKRSRSEATSLGALKYPNWQKGLSKETDSRIKEMSVKLKRIFAKKRKQRLKNIENKYGKTIKDLINTLYWKEELTQEKIAKKLGLSRDLIIRLMKELDISKRPNFEYISSLKGKNHSHYGKKWEEVMGIEKARVRKKKFSLRARRNIIRRLENNEMPFVNTKIEQRIAKELTKRKIPYTAQFSLDKRFVCDFALPFFNIVIECDGDYWHANPKIYDRRKLNNTQKVQLKRDKAKNKYLKENGVVVFRFFESDINKSSKKCIDKVEKEIKEQVKSIKNPLDNL